MITKMILKFLGPQTASAAIIERNGRVLLTKRSKLIIEGGKWCLPGGHIKYKETAENTVKREIKEEIGVDAKSTKFLFYHEEFMPEIGLHSIALVFKLDFLGKLKKNWEVSEMKWFNKKEISKLNIAFKHKDILDRYFGKKK